MGFIEELENLSTRIAKQKDLAAQNEQATKNALIEPFIEFLGYDVRDLTEVKPESDADFVGKKRPKKADYAILKDNAPIMLIECKPYGSNLDNHTSQLQGYFAADDDAQIGIMTDGGLYRFYSDLEKPNKMDGVPFLEFDLFDIQKSLGKELEQFTKSKFNLEPVLKLKMSSRVNVYVYSLETSIPSNERHKHDSNHLSHGFDRCPVGQIVTLSSTSVTGG